MTGFWHQVFRRFLRHRLGTIALIVLGIYVVVGLYAPFLASSKPLIVRYDGHWYFPLFRYLLYKGFYTKAVDLFFNILMFTAPIALFAFWKRWLLWVALGAQILLFSYFWFSAPHDPAASTIVDRSSWAHEVEQLSPYAKLNQVLRYRQRQRQHERFTAKYGPNLPTLWQADRDHLAESNTPYLRARDAWLQRQSHNVSFALMPLIRPFHWQEDAGGSQGLNQIVDWWDLTRINRKDLVASLIFGIRISLVVGLTAVFLSLLIGIPLGAAAGFYGGKVDILLCRFLEVWEAMPTFFMLLMVVAIIQSKSIFLVVAVLGFFGWTGFARFLRGEFLKQRNLAYVEAGRAIGLNDRRLIFREILPNAIPPLLTLLPFAMMAAITSEAGLSFLGLGEEGSTSWGVLMDEGRTAFPSESYLLWPPAILLTLLLVAIAVVGDALRDALDPKLATD